MKDSKTFVIVGLLIAIVVMSVGYAALGQKLTVNGTANIASDASWNVKIVSIEETGKSITPTEIDPSTSVGESTGTTLASNITGSTTASFDVTLNAPGDWAEFTVTVKNLGTIDAVLDALTFVTGDQPAEIVYTVTPADASGATTLSPSNTETYVVKVSWDESSEQIPEVKQKRATLTLDYVQDSTEAGA